MSRPTPLGRGFFLPPPDQVGRALLGKLVVRRYQGEMLTARIVETEAYFGTDDAAAHAFGGRTARNQVLFGPPGHAYVYFIYGMHHCLNVSCEPEGEAGCVLIRALEPVAGLATMVRLRGLRSDANPRLVASGPGRLCQALGITRLGHDGVDLTRADSELYLAEAGPALGSDGRDSPSEPIAVSPRIGVRKSVELPGRFFYAGHPHVSSQRDASKPAGEKT